MSKIIPQKEKASSSRPADNKTPVEPRPEECVPGVCVLTYDFKIGKALPVPDRYEPVSRLGQRCGMRPPSSKKETSAPVPKPAKDNKRKKASTSKDPKLNTRTARKTRKNTILLTEESVRHLRDEDEEKENDGSILVARVKKTIDAPKAAGSMAVDEALSRTEGISEKDSGQALALHQEEFSKSRAELSRREADFRGLSEERNALKLLSGKKEEEMKDLRATLAKAHQDQTDLNEWVIKILKAHGLDSGKVANISISQLQQKIERIEQFREEVDTIKAESLGWKEGMDHLAAKKETARDQLSSIESQLQGMNEKSSAQVRKIEELEAWLASEFSKTGKAKVEADAIVAIYQSDAESAQVQAREAAETAQTREYWVAELAKCQSQRETLEEIHARGFDLTEEILKAKELEVDDGALASDDDDDDESKSGSESGEEPDGEETAPGDNHET
ncbi:uncharacterized protein [Nicotiana tomentosiformis]|uniref:uncharacterized protein n=1 Tax=Nicotiana tomentosiformis TaxID=4098 RepID=UPI00388CC42A